MYHGLLESQKAKRTTTEVDPEVKLQFLKSAIFYFLTDSNQSKSHLEAIEKILGFSEEERTKINKAVNQKWCNRVNA